MMNMVELANLVLDKLGDRVTFEGLLFRIQGKYDDYFVVVDYDVDGISVVTVEEVNKDYRHNPISMFIPNGMSNTEEHILKAFRNGAATYDKFREIEQRHKH